MKFSDKRTIIWLAAPLGYILFALLVHAAQVGFSSAPVWVDDGAYRSLVVAEHLRATQTYGAVPGEPAVMVQDMLWRGLLALMGATPGRILAAAHWLGLFLAGAALWWLARVCVRLLPGGWFAAFAVGGLVLLPGLAQTGLSGGSAPLALFLLTVAVVLHLEQVADEQGGLPWTSALLIGLAAWIRIELLLVWVVLWLHLLSMAVFPRRFRPPVSVMVLRGVNGLLLQSLVLLPLWLWNMRLLGVPWPRLPGARVSLDQGVVEGVTGNGAGWAVAYQAFWEQIVAAGPLLPLLVVAGAAALLWRIVARKDDLPYALLLLIPLLVPLLYGLVVPFLGLSGLPLVTVVFQPWVLLLAIYGAVHLPAMSEAVWGRGRAVPRFPDRALTVYWGALITLLLLSALFGQRRATTLTRVALYEAAVERQVLTRTVEVFRDERCRVVTDQPGWLVWRHGVPVVDVHGEWTPEIARMLNRNGRIDVVRLAAYTADLDPAPSVLALWGRSGLDLLELLPDARTVMRPDPEHPARPFILLVPPRAAP